MSDSLMETSPGGENTQYESIKTVTNTAPKQSGQLGDSETTQASALSSSAAADTERGQKTADNIRYGQNISESGMGGMTTTSDSSANQGSGYGHVQGNDATTAGSSGGNVAGERKKAGYGLGEDMNNSIGG